MMAQLERSKGEVEPSWQQWATGDVALEATAFPSHLPTLFAPSLPIIKQPLPHAPTSPIFCPGTCDQATICCEPSGTRASRRFSTCEVVLLGILVIATTTTK